MIRCHSFIHYIHVTHITLIDVALNSFLLIRMLMYILVNPNSDYHKATVNINPLLILWFIVSVIILTKNFDARNSCVCL